MEGVNNREHEGNSHHGDGTSKKGREYYTFQCGTKVYDRKEREKRAFCK